MSYSEEQKERIYVSYHEKVFGYMLSHVNNRELAEDLCSDVFLKVYENIEKYDGEKASVSTWIYTISRNTLTDHFRTRHVSEEIPEELGGGDTPEDAFCRAETLEGLATALKKLPERERNIAILHYYSGKTLKEIAEKLGISYAYVKILNNKALEELKKFLG